MIARHRATRLFSPPESVLITRSGSGAFRCIIAVWIRVSIFHASLAVICCSNSDCIFEFGGKLSYFASKLMMCSAPPLIVCSTVASSDIARSCDKYPITKP